MMKATDRFRRLSTQEGATLIEALVSILILSIGLLGIAGMQLNALAYQKSSWATHRTAELTGDIAERLRSNPMGATNGNYNYTAAYSTAKSATLSSNNCRTSGAACTTAQLANDDLAALFTKAQASLPGGAIRIEGTINTGFTVTTLYADKDYVSASGVPQAAPVCASGTSGIEWRNCCPSAAAVPDGVRCSRTLVVIPKL